MELVFDGVVVKDGQSGISHELSFCLPEGNTMAIVGSARSGKSVLLLTASGYTEPKSGGVFVRDESTGQAIAAGARTYPKLVSLGPIPDYSPLFGTLTVKEHLLFQLRLHRKKSNRDRFLQLVTEFDLERVVKQRIKDLDHFSYTRTAIAVAAACRPSFILLAEPLQGLTEEELSVTRQYFSMLNEQSIGIVYTTSLDAYSDWGDWMLRIPEGEVTKLEHVDRDGCRVAATVEK